jgi:hypothetical protein
MSRKSKLSHTIDAVAGIMFLVAFLVVWCAT